MTFDSLESSSVMWGSSVPNSGRFLSFGHSGYAHRSRKITVAFEESAWEAVILATRPEFVGGSVSNARKYFQISWTRGLGSPGSSPDLPSIRGHRLHLCTFGFIDLTRAMSVLLVSSDPTVVIWHCSGEAESASSVSPVLL